jgi:hypothetical protein
LYHLFLFGSFRQGKRSCQPAFLDAGKRSPALYIM